MELTLYFLRLAPWIVRPAPPSARAGTMMAAIRTKFKVALKRSRFADMPAPPPPNEAGGCWKELPKKKASGTLRTRITAASSPTALGSKGSTRPSGRGP